MESVSSKPWLVRTIEARFSRRPPIASPGVADGSGGSRLRDGARVAVVGAGIAGPAFARRLLTLSMDQGKALSVMLFNRPSCNYCGGLITDLSLKTMQALYRLEPSPASVLTRVGEVVFVNPRGSVPVSFESPLTSIFRTSRFGEIGFDDDFRKRILEGMPEGSSSRLRIVEPCQVLEAVPPKGEHERGRITYSVGGAMNYAEVDCVVMASGLRSIDSRMLRSFAERTGYTPPQLMDACVTELDVSGARKNRLGTRLVILDGIIEHCVIALIPKRPSWITVTSLEKTLSMEDMKAVFSHPAVTEWLDLPDVEERLRCRRICAAGVYTSTAKRFYGDGWVVIGDLTGYGRVLKDGYFAALLGAELAAETMINYGCSSEAFAQHYHGKLASFGPDNRVGIGLFRLNSRLTRRDIFNRALVRAMDYEREKNPYGGLLHAAFRALSTGDISYRTISMMFGLGLLTYGVKRPLEAFGLRRVGPGVIVHAA
ncbi:MAG: hypothetical protein Q7T82_03660 [Armatimonadota bacterium]|nr:hypothetical protein [Armatimonadota bacterium]